MQRVVGAGILLLVSDIVTLSDGYSTRADVRRAARAASEDFPEPDVAALPPAWSALLNLVAPGAGLVAAGHVLGGWLIGVLFAGLSSLTLAGALLIPDAVSLTTRWWAFAGASTCYLGAPLWLARLQRGQSQNIEGARRIGALREAEQFLREGDAAAASALLVALTAQHPRDLLIAWRSVQAADMLGERQSLEEAQRRLRALDRDGVYRGIAPQWHGFRSVERER